jgi:hypothetical protein
VSHPRRAWVALGGVTAFGLLGLALDLAAGGDIFEFAAFLILGAPFAVFGALIASRQPGQPIGWLMLGVGLALSLATASDGMVRLLLEHPAAISPGWPALISADAFRAFFLSVVATLLLVPTGRLPSRRWRVVAGAVWSLAALSIVLQLLPGSFSDWKEEGIRNPIGVEALGGVLRPLDQIATGLTMILLLVSVASVAWRFRGAQGVERAQLRWIAAAVVATAAMWVVMIVGSLVIGDGRAADALWAIALLSFGLVPVGIGIAVVRYRLYEIDRLISRALVYGVLTVVLAVAYVGLVLSGQAIFSSVAGGGGLVIAASTLVVAALFLPLRSRVQGFVDRRFYRGRYDAQRTLEAFGARLRDQVDSEKLGRDLRGVVTDTMQPSHVSLWRRTEVRR